MTKTSTKKALLTILCTIIALSLYAQEKQPLDDLWPVRSAKFTQGFTRPVAGEKLDFLPNLQPGHIALFLQATDGTKPIEFETDPMPASGHGERVTFLWEAALATSTREDPARFEMLINGEPWFVFGPARDKEDRHWIIRGKEGAELAFVSSFTDPEKGDHFGYTFLTVPRNSFTAGKPIRIRIVAEGAGIPDWYMAFQNRVQPAAAVYVMPALVRENGHLRQPLQIEYTHLGVPAAASIRVDGEELSTADFHPGENKAAILLDPVTEPKTLQVEIVVAGAAVSAHQALQKPVRRFEVYFLPHSHVDIGFTHKQAEVERMQWRNFEEGVELARKTAAYPEGARYRWNVEVLWAVDGYLKSADPEKREAFIDAVRQGWIGLDALYGSELTGLQRPEELMHNLSFANRIEEAYGIPVESAMITDVPGYAWGIVPALAQNGVKYFSIGPNHMPHLAHGGYQVGYTFEAWGDIPFYWESPSGQEKVLFWMTRHGYSWFHDWLLGKIRRNGGEPILKFLDELDEEGYPYDIVQLRYTLGDNGGPDTEMPEFIREWNDRYEFPKFRIATTMEMFRAFESRYGGRLPTYRGDFTPYWEDGAASSAVETAVSRNAAEQLVQAETLWAMLNPDQFPKEDFDEAWTNVVLFSEHTWGSYTSKTDPEGELAQSQWQVKQAFALDAGRQAEALTRRAPAAVEAEEGTASSFLVFNTTSWLRTDVVRLPPGWLPDGFSIAGPDGKPVPSQKLSSGETVFLARDIAPFSAALFTIKKGAPKKGKSRLKASSSQISNDRLTVAIDEKTGAVSGIRHKDLPFDLVDSADEFGFNEYWYTGLNAADPRRSSKPVVRIKENGPVTASLVIESQAPGANRLTREIQLFAGLDRIDITNVVDKIKILEDENVRFSFPFHVPDGQVRVDLAWAVMRPEEDQLKGANKNFFCPQHWVDISGRYGGVTWANPDAPLLEIGGMYGQNWMSDMRTRPWIKTYQPSNRLFSWVMNNAWFVNYKAYQEGPTTFRYSIRPHTGFDSGEAKKFGIGLTQPLIAVPAKKGQGSIPSMLTLEGSPSIIATSFKPARDGNGWVIRLFNASDLPATVSMKWGEKKPEKLYLSNPKETISSEHGQEVHLHGWGILTLRVVY
jgi:alpha-mannosidase